MNNYPEAEKVASVKDKSQSIGLFLDWLFNSGNTLCQWHDDRYYDGLGDLVDKDNEFANFKIPEGYEPIRADINSLLAEYFDIDLVKYEDEKRQMLDQLRNEEARSYK